MKRLLVCAAGLLVAASASALITPDPLVQVYDFRASLKNSNVGKATDRKANTLYDRKFSELNMLGGYLVVPNCSSCGFSGGKAMLYVYRLRDCDKKLYRVPAMIHLADVFATRADYSGLVLGREVEGFLTFNFGEGLGRSQDAVAPAVTDIDPLPITAMAGFFNAENGSSQLAPYLDTGNTLFWAAGFGRTFQGKGYWEEIPSSDPCLPPEQIWIPGCLLIESLCGQIVGLLEYDYVCAPPYLLLCSAALECVNTTQNAVASGSWQIRRNARMESSDVEEAEFQILEKLSCYTPFNWGPNGAIVIPPSP